MRSRMNLILFYGLCSILFLSIVKYVFGQIQYFYKRNETVSEKFLRMDNTFFKSLIFINQLPKKHLFLTFDQSLMYKYTQLPYLSYLDPQFLPVYQAKSTQAVYEILKRMNIKYVDTFSIDPVLINSYLIEMLNDPQYAELIYQSDKRIYQLNDEVKKINQIFIPLKDLDFAYRLFPKNLLITKNLFFHHQKKIYTTLPVEVSHDENHLFHSNNIFQVQFSIFGFGLYQLVLDELNSNYHSIRTSVIDQDVVNHELKKRHVQFLLSPKTHFFKLSYELCGVGKIDVKHISLRAIPRVRQKTQWILFYPKLLKDKSFKLKRSLDQFLIHQRNDGFFIGNFSMRVPMIVSKAVFNHRSQIDFDVKGKGCFDLFLLKRKTIIKKLNIQPICLKNNDQHFHFENLSDMDDYHLGIYFQGIKKDNLIKLKNFKIN
jgi:hypothetical protein